MNSIIVHPAEILALARISHICTIEHYSKNLSELGAKLEEGST